MNSVSYCLNFIYLFSFFCEIRENKGEKITDQHKNYVLRVVDREKCYNKSNVHKNDILFGIILYFIM